MQTMVNCIDNSGAAVVECVNVLRRKTAASVGECLDPFRSFDLDKSIKLTSTAAPYH